MVLIFYILNFSRKYYVSLPILIIIGLIFPFILGGIIYLNKRKNRLKNLNFLYSYGFVYYAFEDDCMLWEFIIIGRKLILLMLTVIFAE